MDFLKRRLQMGKGPVSRWQNSCCRGSCPPRSCLSLSTLSALVIYLSWLLSLGFVEVTLVLARLLRVALLTIVVV